MGNGNFFATIWMFLLPLCAIIVPIWLGQRYGLYIKKNSGEIPDAPLSSMVGATLGLFAFMLAFIFQLVGSRYEKRKELLLSEVSDIRTSYLYAGLIPEPLRSNSRNMIRTYVDIRVEFSRDRSKFEEVRFRSEKILDSLWHYSEILAQQDRSSEAYSLFTASISSLVTLFNQRITVGLITRLPVAILYVLSLVAFFSMLTLGYQFGTAGGVRNAVIIVLGITFSVVMWLIFALDRPETGLISVNWKPMIILQEQLHQR